MKKATFRSVGCMICQLFQKSGLKTVDVQHFKIYNDKFKITIISLICVIQAQRVAGVSFVDSLYVVYTEYESRNEKVH